MALFDRLKSDNKRILTNDMHDITLYNSSNISQTGKGRFTSPGIDVNPQGQMINTKKYTIAFHIDNFPDITAAEENYKDWEGEFLNSEGKTIRGVFNKISVDTTFGYVVTTLTLKK